MKKVLTALAFMIAVLAVVIALVGRLKPTLFLPIPHVGFVFYALVGGFPIPPFFSGDAWEKDEMKTWIKDGDVVVATGVKSGTTWMLYCSHVIRTKANPDVDFGDISLSTPWPDLVQVPGMSWQEHKKRMFDKTWSLEDHGGKSLHDFWNNESFPFRIFKSHMTPIESGGVTGVLPVRSFPKVKFLAMARNGLDVVYSLVPFMNSHDDEFRAMWGGFPPKSSGIPEKDQEDRLTELLPGGNLYELYFPYVSGWWPFRHDPNVLFLHYSDAKKDLRGTVSKLARFFEVDLSNDELDAATEMCSFNYMKKRADMFSYELPLNPTFSRSVLSRGAVIRKGVNGDGKIAYSEEQQQRWRKAEEELLPDPVLRNWAREGGDSKEF